MTARAYFANSYCILLFGALQVHGLQVHGLQVHGLQAHVLPCMGLWINRLHTR